MIHYIRSSQVGAPALSGTAGTLKSVLKSGLADGLGISSVSSLVVTGGIATATLGATHPFIADGAIQLAGATPAGLNGTHKVLSAAALTTTFAVAGVPDGAATGSITAKVPGAGWQAVYDTGNLLVLKPTVPESTGMLLRLDDGGTTTGRVRGFESMSDASTGVGPFPTDAQVSGGLHWSKSYQANSTARNWLMVADARGAWLAVDPYGFGNYTLYYAGDIAPLKSGDVWSGLLSGDSSDTTASYARPDGCCGGSNRAGSAGAYMPRSNTGLGASILVRRVGLAHNGGTASLYSGASGYSFAGVGPNAANNGLLLTPVEVTDNSSRGTLPGLWHLRNEWIPGLTHGSVIDGTDDMAGRRLLVVRIGPPASNTASDAGVALLDLTGPWSR